MAPSQFLKIHFDIIIPSTLRSSNYLLFRFSHQNPVCTSLLPHPCDMPCPSHYSCFHHLMLYNLSSWLHCLINPSVSTDFHMLRSSVVLNGNSKLKTNLARSLHYYFMLCKCSTEEFKIRLSFESWDCVFGNNDNIDVDLLFSAFLDHYLRIFYTSFPLQKMIERHDNKSWITAGIKISCNWKR